MVIDMKTRRPFRIDQHNDCEPSDAERLAKFVNACMDAIIISAAKIKAAHGLDLALRALHQAADDLKNKDRK